MSFPAIANKLTLNPIGREIAGIAALALPLVLTHLAWIAMGITDIVMLAWLGPEDLAAATLAQHYYGAFSFALVGILSGALPIMAQAVGGKRYGDAGKCFRQAAWIVALFSALGYFGIWQADLALKLAGQSDQVANAGAAYIRIAAIGFPAGLATQLLRQFASAHGRPRLGLIAICLGIVLNAVLDYGLVFGAFGLPRLEIIGAGLATAISYWLACLAMVLVLARDRKIKSHFPFPGAWRPDRRMIVEIFRIGLPIGAIALSEIGVFIASSFVIGHFGIAQVGGHGIAGEVASIAYTIPVGLLQAVTVRVGWAIGRGEAAAVRLVTLTGIGCGAVCGLLLAVAIWLGRDGIVGFVLGPAEVQDPQLWSAALGIMSVVAVYQIFDAPLACANGALRGMKDTRWPMFVFLVDFWLIGAALALWFGFGLDLKAPGIWAGLSCGIALTLAVLIWRIRWRLGRIQSIIDGES